MNDPFVTRFVVISMAIMALIGMVGVLWLAVIGKIEAAAVTGLAGGAMGQLGTVLTSVRFTPKPEPEPGGERRIVEVDETLAVRAKPKEEE